MPHSVVGLLYIKLVRLWLGLAFVEYILFVIDAFVYT